MKNDSTTSLSIPREALIYAFAHTETWLEDYAKSHRLPAHELTGGVEALLLAQESGTVLGTFDRLPALRGTSAKGNKTARQVAVAKRPYRKTQVKKIQCVQCGKKFAPQGFAKHMYWKHQH